MDRQNLVLVPGLICTDALFAPQIDALSPYAEIMVADHRRHDSMAAIAAAILEKAPRFFALGGLSMGGYIAFEIMRQAPERVTKLALMDTSARPDTDEQRKRRAGLIDQADHGKFKGVTRGLLPLFIHEDRLHDAPLVETIMQMAKDTGREAFKRQQTAIMGRADSRPLLPSIQCPTVVVCGRQDALTPLALAQEMADGIPAARLEIVEDCGHLPTLERPEAVNAILKDWLVG